MTVSRDLVNHNKQSLYKLVVRNEKSMLEIENWYSLKPLALKSAFLWHYSAVKSRFFLIIVTSNLPKPRTKFIFI
jgi:hypothetical protein